jgi:hypothetical protein
MSTIVALSYSHSGRKEKKGKGNRKVGDVDKKETIHILIYET